MSGRKFLGAAVRIPVSRMGGPAFSLIGLAGLGLYVNLLLWSRAQQADGLAPRIIAERLFRGAESPKTIARLLGQLIEVGLLERAGEDYRIVDYSAFADTKAQIAGSSARGSKRAKAARLRPTIIERDGLLCRICGGGVAPHDVHIDHIEPVSRGGSSEPNNLRVTHRRCNLLKGAS